jgi:hypothetical protein
MDATRPRGRRKLNKSQIIDILERNVALYKEEENFVHYLVELTVYLMEYEYDWAESAQPKGNTTSDSNNLSPISSNTLPPAEAPRGNNIQKGPARIQIEARALSRHLCPYCGTNVGELLICPACRNVTR